MADIFISYKREEIGHAQRFAKAFHEEGFSTFFDLGQHGIHAGETWDKRLETELAQARCCVVLWSPASAASDNVRSEARRAKGRDILVPALIARCVPPIGLDALQSADLIGWGGDRTQPQFRFLVDSGVRKKIHKNGAKSIIAPMAPTPAIAPATESPRWPSTERAIVGRTLRIFHKDYWDEYQFRAGGSALYKLNRAEAAIADLFRGRQSKSWYICKDKLILNASSNASDTWQYELELDPNSRRIFGQVLVHGQPNDNGAFSKLYADWID